MKADRDIVEGSAQARGKPIARLAQNVGPPDNVGVFRLEGRKQSVEAIADCGVKRRVHIGRHIH